MKRFTRRLIRTTVVAAAVGFACAGCAPESPQTPTTYRDDRNADFELTLEADGVARVNSFPAVSAGECITLNNWAPSIMRSGDATWLMGEGNTIRLMGDGWVADLDYVWRRASPDFTELRYPTCPNEEYKFFIIRSY